MGGRVDFGFGGGGDDVKTIAAPRALLHSNFCFTHFITVMNVRPFSAT